LTSEPGVNHPARFFMHRFAFAVIGFQAYGEGVTVLIITGGVS